MAQIHAIGHIRLMVSGRPTEPRSVHGPDPRSADKINAPHARSAGRSTKQVAVTVLDILCHRGCRHGDRDGCWVRASRFFMGPCSSVGARSAAAGDAGSVRAGAIRLVIGRRLPCLLCVRRRASSRGWNAERDRSACTRSATTRDGEILRDWRRCSASLIWLTPHLINIRNVPDAR